MRQRQSYRLTAIGLAMVALLTLTACAARGPLAKAQVAAVSIGQSAHEIRMVESGLYQQGRFDQATHLQLLERGVLPILEAATAYERAVRACTEAPCTNIDQASKALTAALDQLDQITPKVDAVRTPLAAATAALRVLLAKQVAIMRAPVNQATEPMPSGGLIALLAAAEMIAGAYRRIREKLQQDGATPEQLAAIDAMLVNDQAEVRSEIAQIKAEQAGG